MNGIYAETRTESSDSSTVMGTTQVVNDAAEVVSTISHALTMDSGLLISSKSTREQDIHSFLSKPYPIQSGVLSGTDTISTFSPITLYHSILSLDIYNQKIKGHLGFRAKTIFNLQVNGNRFQQGRYILAWTPSGGVDPGTTAATNWNKMHGFTRMQLTQLPHVELDINCDTMVTLEVPYVSVFPYYPLASIASAFKPGSNGIVQIYPYSPVVSPAGSTTASYTLWVHFEDVELVGPTVPQMAPWKSNKKMATEKEAIAAGIAPITGTLIKMSESARVLSQVPLLSSLTAPASWALDIMSQVTSIFGWSRPTNLEATTMMIRSTFPYYSNIDQPDNSMPIAAYASNKVEVLPGFASTDVDETALKHIQTIPAFYESFTWTTAQTTGTFLKRWSLTPSTFFQTFTDTGASATSILGITPVAWVSSNFSFYRGSLTFNFKLVKTEFHSGRLAVVFVPYESRSITAPSYTYNDTLYAHREIIDVREGNSFTINVPWVSLPQYRNTGGYDAPYGELTMWVVDALVAPATVSSTVTILTEVAGGPDLEFAVPITNSLSPVVPIQPQSGRFRSPADPCSIEETTVGGADTTRDTLVPARMCIGERIVSLNALLKRNNRLDYTGVPPTADRYLNILPYCSAISVNTAVALVSALNTPDLYCQMSAIYALSRGGLRYRIWSSTNADRVNLTTWLHSPDGNFGAYVDRPFTYNSTGNLVAANPNKDTSSSQAVLSTASLRPGTEVLVPQYNQFHSRTNATSLVCPILAQYTFNSTNPRIYLTTDLGVGNTTEHKIARSGAEDISFGGFVSIPSMINIRAGITSSY